VPRRGRLAAFNLGILLVWVSFPVPWAEVAGRVRTGPAFADLLLDLPEIDLLGSHLRIVALVWYSIPLLALVTWLTQFGHWPPHLTRWSQAGALGLALVVGASVSWLALRGVGFPQTGPVVAGLGAGLVLLGVAHRPRGSERVEPARYPAAHLPTRQG
jgi:hypothetical protein